MRWVKTLAWALVAVFLCNTVLHAQHTGFGSRIRNLSWFKGGTDAVASRPNSAPVAPRQSQPAFPRSSIAPQPSVTIPRATSPTGDIPLVARNEKPAFGSRIWGAMDSARESLTIKPREIAAPDPIRLDNRTPANVQAPVFVSAARVYEMQGRFREAREYYNKALAAESEHLDALIGLARLEHREGNLVAATEKYQQALQAHPNNAVALNDLGLCYARRNMLPQARESIARAVKQDSQSKLYRNNLALVLVEMGRSDAALTQLKAVHNESIAHYNMAYLLREKSQHDAAAEHLRTALRIDPRMEPARAMLAQLNPAPYTQADAPRLNPSPATRNNAQLGAPRNNAQLGAPQIAQPRGAPVINRSINRSIQSPASGQRMPVSHRQPVGSNAPTGPNAPTDAGYQPTTRPNWNTVAPVTPGNAGTNVVRPQNGQQPGYNPSRPSHHSNRPGHNPSRPGYNSSHREAPSPGQMPDYLQRSAPAPSRSPAQPPASQGGSRWSTPR